jgi:hypothetical protein
MERLSSKSESEALPESEVLMLEIGTGRPKIVRRVTREEYGYGHKKRKLVVKVEPTDLITIKEFKSRRQYSARVWDVYVWMVRCAADKAHMEKLRLRKQKKADQLSRRRIAAADRRLRRTIQN